ncbi:MAG: prolipoprotein diacylglyceryl transferase, partial [Clostridia bacterium]|nr:prolipoprotein diacylglyceryl transferase [Clostridia bacterium]
VLAVLYVMWRAKQNGVKSDDILDLALVAVPSGIAGARLYFVLTSLDHFDSFWDIFKIWEGGLAIYGGIIGGAIAVIIMARIKKLPFFLLADMIMPAVLIGQILGRWGNFFNVEAHGTETMLPWRMGILRFGEWTYVHPTFLYESLWNLLGVLLVYLFAKLIGKKYDGQLILLTFGWYGLGRMFIEGLRTDSLYIPGTEIRTSQALALVIFVFCLAMLIFFMIKKPTKPLYVKVNEEKPEAEKTEDPIVVMVKKIVAKIKSGKDNNEENDK